MKAHRLIAVVLSVVLLPVFADAAAAEERPLAEAGQVATQAKPVSRLAGSGRVETAAAVSQAGWGSGAETALLATAGDFPDALAAGALAASLDAPLLLSAGDRLLPVVAAELERLGAGEVLLLGGAGAIPAGVERDVRALRGAPQTRRLAGEDRFATAQKIAAEAGAPSGAVTVASGSAFPDALSAASLAAVPERMPTLLTMRAEAPAPTLGSLAALDPDAAIVIGGAAAVARPVLDTLAATGASVSRLSGDSRFTTSQAVVEDARPRFDDTPRPLLVATGADYPDALAAGAMAARDSGPLLLVPGDGLTPGLTRFIRGHHERFSRAVVIGGAGVVSDATLGQVEAAINDVDPPSVEPPDPETVDLSDDFPTGEVEIERSVARRGDQVPGVLVLTRAAGDGGQGRAVTANLFEWSGKDYRRVDAMRVGCEWVRETGTDAGGGVVYLECDAGANGHLVSVIHAEPSEVVLHPRSLGDGYDGWSGLLEGRIRQPEGPDDLVVAVNSCEPSCSHGNHHHYYLTFEPDPGAYFAYGVRAYWGEWFPIDPPANVSWEYGLYGGAQGPTDLPAPGDAR